MSATRTRNESTPARLVADRRRAVGFEPYFVCDGDEVTPDVLNVTWMPAVR